MAQLTVADVIALIQEHEVKFADLRFTDTRGKEQHVTLPAQLIDEDFFTEGKAFDGSSIAGWAKINASDMLLMPDASTAVLDPFFEDTTVNIRCNVHDPMTMTPYNRDPRSIALAAEDYLRRTGIADCCYCGPEPEFFIFDDVRFKVTPNLSYYEVDSREGMWNSDASISDGNLGHRPRTKGGYFPVPPVDSSQDIRSAMCLLLEEMGLQVEVHHHEVASGNQNEIGTTFNTLLRKADELQIFKYVVHNVADAYGKSATFMPKPIIDDNGSGMHVHQSLFKDGKNIFSGDGYAGLSQTALYYIGGIIKHARALNAFTNATTNSYKRLVPGYEAPVMLAYSARNRSASIRIPYTANPKARRIEVRFPDAVGNPYFTFAAMLLAGLDGIKHKIHPGDAMDKDLYDLPPEEARDIPTVCSSLQQALQALSDDREFLTTTGVFNDDIIDSYIALKQEDVNRILSSTHPAEFDMYYSL